MPNSTDATQSFTRVDPRVDLPTLEEEVLDLWDRIDAFAQSVEMRPADRRYVFYDGPPFANGNPHYGHILAGIIKDVVPRYWTMKGYRVERRFGWDTHGLPVEMEVEKSLGISGPRQIGEYGIDRFNAACRALVENTAEEWAAMVRRVGRWVDMENDYKTMDLDFMESVWWVFSQLWSKGLVYKDFKVLPYSWGATTPLSNFEANLDYRDTEDPSITVKLEVEQGNAVVEVGDQLLIWTTTPWTLPGNLAVAVGESVQYTRAKVGSEHWWLATDRLEEIAAFGSEPGTTAMGSDLVGVVYRPPFDFFGEERDRGAFQVIESQDVTTDEGTGLVHMAPAYGEADFTALQSAGFDVLVDPVDAEGSFTDAVEPVAGLNVKDADPVLVRLLRDRGVLVKSERIHHSYPYCYRTGTPLIYKAIPTWFVSVERFRDSMVKLNQDIHWVPGYVGDKRFGNWLEGARDWAISRNRYWGSCIPIWECDACEHTVCIGSIDQLEARSGVRPDDLHKHVVDQITWACPQSCGGTMRRVPEVLDCWFESGSMPYAQIHYPFENRDVFEQTYPAQFIAEGLDQTRGWFYTLHVLATALFEQPSFRNCVVNGMILAEDGRKMSKSLRNYPDPMEVFATHGADAVRAFLINSPVLRAEPLRFSEDGVRNVVRTALLPLWNTYSFFTTYAEADGITIADLQYAPPVAERPEIDRWILSVLQSLVGEVNLQMDGYYLYAVVPPMLDFIDDLTNWYVRRSRRRFWAARTERFGDGDDKLSAFATLYEVLATFAKVLAPLLPFVTETIYQGLVAKFDPEAPSSVHHCDFPRADEQLIDGELEQHIKIIRTIVGLGHSLRKQHQIKVRQPLHLVSILSHDPSVAEAVAAHTGLISDELNVRSVVLEEDETHLVDLSAKCDFRALGSRLGPRMKEVAAEVQELGTEDVSAALERGWIEVQGERIAASDLLISRSPKEGTVVESDGDLGVALDITLDEELISEGVAREIVSRIQSERRRLDLDVTDRIQVEWHSDSEALAAAFAANHETIAAEVLARSVSRVTADDQLNAVEPIDGRELYVRVSAV